MKELVRIISININGIKNVCHGAIKINTVKEIESEEFKDNSSILGIYGQNSSGKSAVIDATHILKYLIKWEKLPDDIDSLINFGSKAAMLEYSFYVKSDEFEGIIDYKFEIVKSDDNGYIVDYEKLSIKKLDEGKWSRKSTLFEIRNGEITYSKIKNMISKETRMFLQVLYDNKAGESMLFGNGLNERVRNELFEKGEWELPFVVDVLKKFAINNLSIIRNGEARIFKSDSNGKCIIKVSDFDSLKRNIEQLGNVIECIIPSMKIDISIKDEKLLDNGEKRMIIEFMSVKEGYTIPLIYESKGIKRIVPIIHYLIKLYNNESMCLMVDDLDLGINEYLFGELVKIFDTSAKGQLIFTSNNFRALEMMSYKKFVFTTTNPDNKYIRLHGVGEDNPRDFYYSSILLGGQEEELYDETRNYRIERAFRIYRNNK